MNGTYFGKKLYSIKLRTRISKKIKFLGQKKPISTYEFLNIRLVLCIIIFTSSLFIPKFGFIIGLIFTAIFYNGYEIILLDYPIKKRMEKLENEAIFYLEVLDATMSTKEDFLVSLNSTSENINSDLAIIIKNALLKLKQDGDINKVVEELKSFIPSAIVVNVFSHLLRINTNIYHEEISKQIIRIKEKQNEDLKHELNKMPIKIIITSIIFISILFVIIYYGPLYIKGILNWQDKLFRIV